jgi:hypothetical protein
MRLSRKRLLLSAGGITAVGAVATLMLGATFGLFSATTPTQTNTFTAGTVTLAQSAVTSCTVSNIQPGDSGSCHFTVTYGGSVSSGAWLGVDLALTSPVAGSPVQAYAPGNAGATPAAAAGLYDSTVNGLQFTITDNQGSPVTYMTGTSWNGLGTSGTTPSINQLLVNTAAFTSSTSVIFTIAWSLPSTANNAYQGAASTITMLVHAVQAGNNGSTGACSTGHTCPGITSWS